MGIPSLVATSRVLHGDMRAVFVFCILLHEAAAQTCTTGANCIPPNIMCQCGAASGRRRTTSLRKNRASGHFWGADAEVSKLSKAKGRRLFGVAAQSVPQTCTCVAASPPPPAASPPPPPAPPPRTCDDVYSSLSTASGVYTLQPRGTLPNSVSVRAYCDMSQTPKGQSIFDLPTGVQGFETGTNVCSTQWSNDDSDQVSMWVDLEGRVGSTNPLTTTEMSYFVVPRDSFPSYPAASALRYIWGTTTADSSTIHYPHTFATSMGAYARPIPFPRSGMTNGVVVWLGPTTVFFRVDFVDYSFSYPTEMQTCLPEASTATYNSNVFVTDGISSLTVGRQSGSTNGVLTCLTVMRFDWSASPYTASMITASPVATSGLSNPDWTAMYSEEDYIGGDLLWTVKGKPSWYSSQYFYLGTSMQQPFLPTLTDQALPPYPGNGATQSGLDIFLKVDSAGALWAGDWGHDNGGMFGCGNDNQLGAMKTNIRLAV